MPLIPLWQQKHEETQLKIIHITDTESRYGHITNTNRDDINHCTTSTMKDRSLLAAGLSDTVQYFKTNSSMALKTSINQSINQSIKIEKLE